MNLINVILIEAKNFVIKMSNHIITLFFVLRNHLQTTIKKKGPSRSNKSSKLRLKGILLLDYFEVCLIYCGAQPPK